MCSEGNFVERIRGVRVSTDSDDEVRSGLSRTGTVYKDNRQGNGVSVNTAAGVFSPRKPRMTSIEPPVPPEHSTGGHAHALVIIDDRTGTKWLQGVSKDVTESPTKRSRHLPHWRKINLNELPTFVPRGGDTGEVIYFQLSF